MIDEYEIVELRILQILESEDKWWTIEEMAALLLISKASVQKYVALLKARIETFPIDQIYIEKSTNKGVFLHRALTFNLQYVYTLILKELLTVSCLNALFTRQSVPILQMALNNFSSVASIRRKYYTINQYFVNKNFDIVLSKDTILGNEYQIRWFFSKFYWKIFKGTEWPFPALPRDIVEEKIKKIQSAFNINFDFDMKEEMLYWLVVNWSRYRQGNRVSPNTQIKSYVLHNTLYPRFLNILEQNFPKSFGKDEEAAEESEVQYLFFLIGALPLLEKNKTFNEHVFRAHQRANTNVYKVTQEWLYIYESTFDFLASPIDLRNFQYKLIRIHSYSYLYNIHPHVIFEDYEEPEITHFPKLKAAIQNLYDSLHILFPDITKNKSYLLENYTRLIIPTINIQQFEKSIRILIRFSKGTLYESIAEEKINTRFNRIYNINFVHNIIEADILITDFSTATSSTDYFTVNVTPKLSKRDFKYIEKTILYLL